MCSYSLLESMVYGCAGARVRTGVTLEVEGRICARMFERPYLMDPAVYMIRRIRRMNTHVDPWIFESARCTGH